MTLEEIRTLFTRLVRQDGISQLTLTGGEPTLHQDLFGIVDCLHELGVRLNLISNGSNLTEDTLDKLSPDKIELFELPLLSVERQIHDQLSANAGAFDRVTQAIVVLKERKQHVVVVFVATRLNLAHFEKTLELALALGCDGLMFNRFNAGGNGIKHRDLLEPAPAQLIEALDQAEAFSLRYHFSISCGVPMPACIFDLSRYSKLDFGSCGAGTTNSYYTVDPAGRLRPCNHSPTILGDLKRQRLDEILAGSGLASFVAACPPECANCRLSNECRGGCKAVSEQCIGAPDVLDVWLARHRRPLP
jgi:PqqA peptide cyclase